MTVSAEITVRLYQMQALQQVNSHNYHFHRRRRSPRSKISDIGSRIKITTTRGFPLLPAVVVAAAAAAGCSENPVRSRFRPGRSRSEIASCVSVKTEPGPSPHFRAKEGSAQHRRGIVRHLNYGSHSRCLVVTSTNAGAVATRKCSPRLCLFTPRSRSHSCSHSGMTQGLWLPWHIARLAGD